MSAIHFYPLKQWGAQKHYRINESSMTRFWEKFAVSSSIMTPELKTTVRLSLSSGYRCCVKTWVCIRRQDAEMWPVSGILTLISHVSDTLRVHSWIQRIAWGTRPTGKLMTALLNLYTADILKISKLRKPVCCQNRFKTVVPKSSSRKFLLYFLILRRSSVLHRSKHQRVHIIVYKCDLKSTHFFKKLWNAYISGLLEIILGPGVLL